MAVPGLVRVLRVLSAGGVVVGLDQDPHAPQGLGGRAVARLLEGREPAEAVETQTADRQRTRVGRLRGDSGSGCETPLGVIGTDLETHLALEGDDVAVPFVAALVPAIDPEAGTVTLAPPGGLFPGRGQAEEAR